MKNFKYFLVCIFFVACKAENPSFKLRNESSMTFDSLHVFAQEDDKTILKSIKPGREYGGVIIFNDSVLGDGCYTLFIYKDKEIVFQKCFGYYTNGTHSSEKFDIVINEDSVSVKQLWRD